MNMMDKINAAQVVERETFSVGDTVKVHVKIIEGSTERVQVFKGIVIKKKGSGVQNFRQSSIW